jgi:PAS domain S-box-containing protein/diguanylate cyclase (GGDEF)-like protein
MADRMELLESALDSLGEGAAVADRDGRVAFWNRTCETITGYSRGDILGHGVREILDKLVEGGSEHWVRQTDAESAMQRGSLVRIRHRMGHGLPVLAKVLILRDEMGTRIGTGVVFHPAESLDALPRGDMSAGSNAGESRTQLEDRLAVMHEDFLRSGIPLGILWVGVDQAGGLRQTHGMRAVEAMLEKMGSALAGGLRPTEEIGRWGDDEFLVLSHERNGSMLAAHGQVLAGMARTTDFRWWGDRISLTVSIGAAQAQRGECLSELLERAQAAMLASVHAGGNHITITRKNPCSPL